VKVNFHLRRTLPAGPPSALLLTSGETDELLALCTRLGGKSMPRVFPVSAGFLIQPDGPVTAPFPRTIRLRRLAANLYVPVDAELLPSLLDDELAALGSRRGLVFLPAGRVLSFDPSSPLPLSALVSPGELRRQTWRPLPTPAPLAEQLTEIVLDFPSDSPDDPVAAWGAGPGNDDPRPDSAGPGAKVLSEQRTGVGPGTTSLVRRAMSWVKKAALTAAGKGHAEQPQPDRAGATGPAQGHEISADDETPSRAGLARTLLAAGLLALGRGAARLGRLLRLKSLARLGGKWMAKAVEAAPRLSEAILGRREAALRALLRDFRLGNIERALRRALPLMEPGYRGARDLGGTKLATHNLKYSLRNVLEGARGPADVWFGHFDVMAELTKEYRKAAAEAVRRGDYRRAAWIYVKILRDYQSAANALSEGGLHHDAAVLYLRIHDHRAAARAFEAAGEIDRAIQLYREHGDHGHAGDLLHRLGEKGAALVEYRLAAEKLARSPQGYLAAGDLMLARAQRPDLALAYFQSGWDLRPRPNATACGLRIADLYTQDGQGEKLLSLLAAAEEFLLPYGNDAEASRFFNALVALAEDARLKGVRDEVRDRALLALAAKLRQRAGTEHRSGNVVSSMLSQSGNWPAALRQDAQEAFRRELQSRPATSTPTLASRASKGTGVVTAVCSAPATGDVFVGFQDGRVICFRSDYRTMELPRDPWCATSLAVDREGKFVFVLRQNQDGTGQLVGHARTLDGNYEISHTLLLEGRGEFWLTPLAVQNEDQLGNLGFEELLLGVWNGEGLTIILARSLLGPVISPPEPSPRVAVSCAHLFAFAQPGGSRPLLFLFDPDSVWCYSDWQKPPRMTFLGWAPETLDGCNLRVPEVAWLQRDDRHIEMAGLRSPGVVRWSLVQYRGDRFFRSLSCVSGADGYHAATIVRAGLVAAVRDAGIDWLRCTSKGFVRMHTTRTSAPPVEACFPSHPTGELIVVSTDGAITRVSIPQ
jgi:tetratricopeptide (TPR) repeat protein